MYGYWLCFCCLVEIWEYMSTCSICYKGSSTVGVLHLICHNHDIADRVPPVSFKKLSCLGFTILMDKISLMAFRGTSQSLQLEKWAAQSSCYGLLPWPPSQTMLPHDLIYGPLLQPKGKITHPNDGGFVSQCLPLCWICRIWVCFIHVIIQMDFIHILMKGVWLH